MEQKKFDFLLMTKTDFYKNEGLEEIFRERSTYYLENNEKRNFWIISFPSSIPESYFYKCLKTSNFFKEKNQKNLEQEPFVIIISTNKRYINWLQLRIGFFEKLFTLINLQNYMEKKDFYSNGITGRIKFLNYKNHLKSNNLKGWLFNFSVNILKELKVLLSSGKEKEAGNSIESYYEKNICFYEKNFLLKS